VGIYRSPNGEQTYDAANWSSSTSVDSQWYNNYKYRVTGFVVENGGTGYSVAPQIVISGGGGSGATAYAVVSNGAITDIVVDSPGENYTTYPTVIVNGLGSGAVAKAVLQNVYDSNNQGHNLVRSISTTIKFDRVDYTDANVPGVTYPGVIVDGNSYTGTVYDSTIQSLYTDTLTGNSNVIIDGGAYYDTFSSHAPEELVPGHIRDGLDFEVYDNANISYRITQNMNGTGSIGFYNINSTNTTTLAQGLTPTDQYIFVKNASVLPNPNPASGVPGVVYIGGEKVNFYRNFHYTTPWTANAQISTNSVISYNSNIYITTGNVYARYFANVAANVTLVGNVASYGNALGQITRAVDGTAAFNNELNYNLTTSAPVTVTKDTTVILSGTGSYGTVSTTSSGNVISLSGPNESFAGGHYLYQFTPGSLISYKSNVYLATANIYEPTGNFSNVSSQLTQIAQSSELGVPIPWAANLIINNFSTNLAVSSVSYSISTAVVDASLVQQIQSTVTLANIGLSSKTYKSATNVSLGLQLTGTITANVGDLITQRILGNTEVARLRVIGPVTRSNVVPVVYLSGGISTTSNLIYLNGVNSGISSTGTYVLGTVSGTGNVTLAANTQVYTGAVLTTLGNVIYKDSVAQIYYTLGETNLGNIAPPLYLLWDDYLPVPSGFAP